MGSPGADAKRVDILPVKPVRSWEQRHHHWALLPIDALLGLGISEDGVYAVEISVSALHVIEPRQRRQLYPWETIERIDAADPPCFACVHLRDGTNICLSEGHLPHDDPGPGSPARLERLALLQRALAASRHQPSSP